MNVVPMRAGSAWLGDARGDGRTLRVSSHGEQGLITVSAWRDHVCTSSVQLSPHEAADLIAALSHAVAECAATPTTVTRAVEDSA